MSLTLYKIQANDFIKTDKINPTELALVLDEDAKEIYIYRPHEEVVYDEYEAEELYNKILNKFLNPNIYILKELKHSPKDSDNIKKIKEFIRETQPSLFWLKLRNFFQNLFLFRKVRRNVEIFQNYHNSGVWRRRISNQSNLWKLSLFNVIFSTIISVLTLLIILLAIRPLFSTTLSTENLQYWLQNLTIYEGILLFLAIIILLSNLLFVLFPLRFSIKPRKYSDLK